MADYKRMVSYMYQYENGIKRRNVGYARVEAKNGQCKVTLHMQLLGQSDSIFPTYLIHREGNHMELVYLGDSMLKNQVMDSKLIADEANIMDSGYSLSEMEGLLIFLNNNIFFATEWDDKPIDAKEVLDAMKPKKKHQENPTVPQKQEPEDVSVMSTKSIPEKKDETDIREISDKAFIPELEDDTAASDIPYPVAEVLSLEEELKIPKYRLPRGWKTIEILQKPYIEEKSGQKEKVINTAYMEPARQPEQEENYKEQNLQEESQAESKDLEIREDPPEAKHFFDNYPRIYPFEDNEILLCVKIEPKDIGLLPKDIWALSNNSFLMHGYYCYHHLIFAKMKGQDSDCYILGIPGIFHNREQFMARMFGFENFKSIRKRDLRQGDFGYWYLHINY